MKKPELKLTIEYGDERVERVFTGLKGDSLYEIEWGKPYFGMPAEKEVGAIIRDMMLSELNDDKPHWLEYTSDGQIIENTVPQYLELWRMCVELCCKIRDKARPM